MNTEKPPWLKAPIAAETGLWGRSSKALAPHEPGQARPPERKRRKAVGVSTAVVACAIALTTAVGWVGTSARATGSLVGAERVTSVADPQDVVEFWEGIGVHGATLVHIARAFRSRNILSTELTIAMSYPVESLDVGSAYRSRLTTGNSLWVSGTLGQVRRIYHVLPPVDLQRRVDEGRRLGYPGIAADGLSIRANADGYLRWISSDIPRLREPVVLLVEASYFDAGGTSEDLVRGITEAELAIALLTLCEERADPNVSDAARDELERFGGSLREFMRGSL